MEEVENVATKSTEAEWAVLGAALLSPDEVVPILTKSLNASDFYERRHQRFCEAIYALFEQNAPIRPTEIVDWLERNDKSRELGELPVSYLNDLLAQAPLVAWVPYYIEKIKESARRRDISARLLAASEKAKTDPDAAIEEIIAQARLDKIAETATNGATPAPLSFPESAYIGLASKFANTYSTACESPKSYFYLSFLTCLGRSLGIASFYRVQPKHRQDSTPFS